MKRSDLKLPLFTVSPKTYLLGDESVAAAKLTDEVAAGREHSIFWTAPYLELGRVAGMLQHAIPTAQHADLVQALKNQPGPDGPGWGIFQERRPGHRLRRPHRKPRENSTASISRESALAAKVSGGPQL